MTLQERMNGVGPRKGLEHATEPWGNVGRSGCVLKGRMEDEAVETPKGQTGMERRSTCGVAIEMVVTM